MDDLHHELSRRRLIGAAGAIAGVAGLAAIAGPSPVFAAGQGGGLQPSPGGFPNSTPTAAQAGLRYAYYDGWYFDQ